MTRYESKKVNDLIHSIGLKYNLTDKEAKEVIESQFKFIRETMDKLDIDSKSLEELDFNKIKTNYMVRHIGKIHATEKRIIFLKNLQNGKQS